MNTGSTMSECSHWGVSGRTLHAKENKQKPFKPEATWTELIDNLCTEHDTIYDSTLCQRNCQQNYSPKKEHRCMYISDRVPFKARSH